jgi:FKBP-type peptidyl-prolyl cis-trans isomerase FkpA
MAQLIGRNDFCICGSNKKFKKCCMNKPGFNLEDFAKEIKQRQKMADLGLEIKDHVVGKGDEAVAEKTISVHYTGCLYDAKAKEKKGKKFDSSVDRDQPFEFKLGAGMVIAGWDQGFAGMKVGGKRTLTISSEMGYGERGAGADIPPNAKLVFDVELLAVK